MESQGLGGLGVCMWKQCEKAVGEKGSSQEERDFLERQRKDVFSFDDQPFT